MSKVSLVKIKKSKYIKIKFKRDVSIDNHMLSVVKSGQVFGLMDIDTSRIRKSELLYEVTDYLPLAEYISVAINRERFINVIFSVLNIIKKLQNFMLPTSGLLLDIRYINVEPQTKMVRFIYAPVKQFDVVQDVGNFFLSLVNYVPDEQKRQTDFYDVYRKYFENKQNFSIYDFELFMRKINGDNNMINQPIKFKNPSKYLGNNKKICPRCKKIYTVMDNYCDVCGVHLVFVDLDNTDIDGQIKCQVEGSDSITSVLDGRTRKIEEDEAVTEILGNRSENTIYPKMIRRKDNSKIELNQPLFSIGKSVNGNNFFIGDNSAISRRHMTFEIRDNKYYVTDEGSTNGTYIDDVRIAEHVPTEIKAGQRLRLADDEFLFTV